MIGENKSNIDVCILGQNIVKNLNENSIIPLFHKYVSSTYNRSGTSWPLGFQEQNKQANKKNIRKQNLRRTK